MGIFDFFRRENKPQPEEKSAIRIDYGRYASAAWPSVGSNVVVNEQTALEVTTVLACVRLIAQDVARLPCKVMRFDEASERNFEEKKSPVNRVLSKRPNRWQTPFEFKAMLTSHALLTGDGIALINTVGGKVDELIPIVPGAWSMHTHSTADREYTITLKDGTSLVVPPKRVLHVRGLTWDGETGLNIVKKAREAIGLAQAMEGTQSRQMGNGGRPSGILTTEQNLKPEQIKAIAEGWRQSVGGENQFRTPVLDGGFKFSPVSLSAVDSQLVETRKHQITEICAAFGVSPAVLGIDDKTQAFASVEAMMRWHLSHTLRPWLDIWEQAIDRDLLDGGDGPLFARFDTREMTKATTKERAESYRTLVELGIMTVNEARELEGLPPIEGGDVPMRPMNMTTGAGDAEKAN